MHQRLDIYCPPINERAYFHPATVLDLPLVFGASMV
jgi:hypothetical protein